MSPKYLLQCADGLTKQAAMPHPRRPTAPQPTHVGRTSRPNAPQPTHVGRTSRTASPNVVAGFGAAAGPPPAWKQYTQPNQSPAAAAASKAFTGIGNVGNALWGAAKGTGGLVGAGLTGAYGNTIGKATDWSGLTDNAEAISEGARDSMWDNTKASYKDVVRPWNTGDARMESGESYNSELVGKQRHNMNHGPEAGLAGRYGGDATAIADTAGNVAVNTLAPLGAADKLGKMRGVQQAAVAAKNVPGARTAINAVNTAQKVGRTPVGKAATTAGAYTAKELAELQAFGSGTNYLAGDPVTAGTPIEMAGVTTDPDQLAQRELKQKLDAMDPLEQMRLQTSRDEFDKNWKPTDPSMSQDDDRQAWLRRYIESQDPAMLQQSQSPGPAPQPQVQPGGTGLGKLPATMPHEQLKNIPDASGAGPPEPGKPMGPPAPAGMPEQTSANTVGLGVQSPPQQMPSPAGPQQQPGQPAPPNRVQQGPVKDTMMQPQPGQSPEKQQAMAEAEAKVQTPEGAAAIQEPWFADHYMPQAEYQAALNRMETDPAMQDPNNPEAQATFDKVYKHSLADYARQQAEGNPDFNGQQFFGETYAKAKSDKFDAKDYGDMISGFATQNGFGPEATQDPGFIQQFVDAFQGMDPWQKIGLMIGIPLAIAGLGNALLGDGGMGSIIMGLVGAGVAGYAGGMFGGKDPLGFFTTADTQPNTGAQGAAQSAPDASPELMDQIHQLGQDHDLPMGAGDPERFDMPDATQLVTDFIGGTGAERDWAAIVKGMSPKMKQMVLQQMQQQRGGRPAWQVDLPGVGYGPGASARYDQLAQMLQAP